VLVFPQNVFFILQGEATDFFACSLLDSCMKLLPPLQGTRKSSEVSSAGSYSIFRFIHIHFISHVHQLISQSVQWAMELTGSGCMASSRWIPD